MLTRERLVKGSSFISKPGNRRNTLNTSAGRTRPFGLATKPLINAGTILLPIPSNVQDGNAVKFGDNFSKMLWGMWKKFEQADVKNN